METLDQSMVSEENSLLKGSTASGNDRVNNILSESSPVSKNDPSSGKDADLVSKNDPSSEKDVVPRCCSSRHKERSQEEIRSLVNRLSRIEGQVRGIRKMVENGVYCPDILTQSAAVSAAMNAFNRQLLSSHVHSCVVEDIRSGKDETVDELCSLLQKLMK